MNKQDTQIIVQEIIARAQEGKFTEFRLITSWDDYNFCKGCKKATKLIIKVLNKSANDLIKLYCKTVITGITDVEQLLAYSELQDIIAFYEKELVTINNMLKEYSNYLSDGNFWYSLFGGERE